MCLLPHSFAFASLFTFLSSFLSSFLGFGGFDWILPSFTGFYWVRMVVPPRFTSLYLVSMNPTESGWVLPSFTVFYRVCMVVLPSFA